MGTLSDIERDIRDRADCAERNGDRETHNDGVAMLLRSIADRIKAAAKREVVSKTETTTVGNAAAIREALKGLDEEMTFCERNVELGIGFALEGLREHCRIVRQILNAALSSPARNCDKMPCIDKLTMHDLANSPCKSTLEYASREELLSLVRWLLAPAAERKGDGDGR